MAMSKITFLGDVFLQKPCRCSLKVPDNLIFNLEYAITKSIAGYPGKVNLKAEYYDHIPSTFGQKPLAVCLANNHILDYNQQGFLDTISCLNAEKIGYYGAGYLFENCNNPLLLELDNFKIALMGYVCSSTSPIFANSDSSPGIMPIDIDHIVNHINIGRKAGAKRLVVSLHWGAEEVYLPKLEDIRMAHRIIDAGADLVVGHHAHRIQPFEIYHGKYIFYGLGNAIMPDLDVPSYYDESGQPTRRFVKKQKKTKPLLFGCSI